MKLPTSDGIETRITIGGADIVETPNQPERELLIANGDSVADH
jgi:hypothetical protein